MIKTYTLCGSMKFATQMQDIAWHLETMFNYNIVQCMYKKEDVVVTEEAKDKLRIAHLKKIDLSDGIYVVDMHGYIGADTQYEIDYAKRCGKEVIYHSSFLKSFSQKN